MTARYATQQEITDWNVHILNNPDGGNVFSSYEYSGIKILTGYRPLFIICGDIAVTVLEKATPPLGKLWYLPKGPNVTTATQLLQVVSSIEGLAKRANAFVIRVESEIPKSSAEKLEQAGLKKATPIIPNPSTITLDISSPLDEVLSKLPQKGRHAIRRAERDGVTVKLVESTDENCRIMYNLLSETAEGQFGIRSYNYYRVFWQTFSHKNLGQLFFAYSEDQPVAGAYAMTYGDKSTYKDGASIRKRTTYGASHLLQWKVIEWAKSRGSELHDFCGSPPSAEIENTSHAHYGVGRFKLSFSKDVKDFIGCYDFIVSKKRYSLWQSIGERVYRKLYYIRTKDYYY